MHQHQLWSIRHVQWRHMHLYQRLLGFNLRHPPIICGCHASDGAGDNFRRQSLLRQSSRCLLVHFLLSSVQRWLHECAMLELQHGSILDGCCLLVGRLHWNIILDCRRILRQLLQHSDCHRPWGTGIDLGIHDSQLQQHVEHIQSPQRQHRNLHASRTQRAGDGARHRTLIDPSLHPPSPLQLPTASASNTPHSPLMALVP